MYVYIYVHIQIGTAYSCFGDPICDISAVDKTVLLKKQLHTYIKSAVYTGTHTGMLLFKNTYIHDIHKYRPCLLSCIVLKDIPARYFLKTHT
jgi:hypothetical protein